MENKFTLEDIRNISSMIAEDEESIKIFLNALSKIIAQEFRNFNKNSEALNEKSEENKEVL